MNQLRSLFLVLMLVCTGSLFAQTNTTGLSGIVTDPSGALIPGATVTIVNTATNLTKSTQSGSIGQYTFNQIPPGRYKVTVAATGFADQEKDVQLLIATPMSLDFKLSVTATQVVNVTDDVSQINTTDASLGTPFDSHTVQSLPYQANNVLSLLSLQAGTLSLDGGALNGGLNTDTRTGTVNGARQDQSNVTLDGTDNNDANLGYAFTGVLRSTRDSVQEFRVQTSNANADSGRSSGAQVALVTRSGTNKYHGSAYEYYRFPGGTANDWFLKQSQLSSDEDNVPNKILQHTFGGTLGMPIKKDKLFFFGAYENLIQGSSSVVSQTVPSVFQPTSGLPTTSDGFGGLVTGTVSYKTASGTQVLTGADITDMDQTGQGLDAAAIAYFNQFPRANSASLGDGLNTGGYVFSSPVPLKQVTNIARIDYNPNSRHNIFVRANLQSDNRATALQFDTPGSAPGSNIYSNNRGITAGWIWSISSTMTNNLRYGFTRQGQATRGGITAGYVSFSGISNLQPTTSSTIYIEPVHNIVDDFVWIKGRHVITFGINDRILINNRYADATLYPSGSVSVALLSNAGVAGKTGNSFDPGTYGYEQPTSAFRSSYNNAILAAAGVITNSTQYANYTLKGNTLEPIPSGSPLPSRQFKSVEQEYYVQDQWKVFPNLTVTAGIRYVYLGVPYETNGQEIAPTISMQDFLDKRVAAAKTGGAFNDRTVYAPAGKANGAKNYWEPQTKNFAPRLAIAWAPHPNTSVRAGYGLNFDHFGDGIINAFDSGGGFKLNSSQRNTFKTIDNSPRFTGYNDVPTTASTAGSITLPYTPPDNSFNFTSNINRTQHTPYAQTANFTVEQKFGHGFSISAGYVARFGRHVLSNWDASQPNNLMDTKSGTTYFQAIDALAKMADQGVDPNNVQKMAYWEDILPNAEYDYMNPTTQQTFHYTGTQAIYAKLLAEDRGNETDIIYLYDTENAGVAPGAADGQYNHFFYPQYGSMFAISSIGTSNYNSGQFTLKQQLRSLQYALNYTWSKSLDLGSTPERSGGGTIYNTFDPAGNYGVSDFDVRHNISANYVADLPFGRNHLLLSGANTLVDEIIGGWQLTGLVHYSTGMPWTAGSSVYGTNFASSSKLINIGGLKTSGHHTYSDAGSSSYYETVFDKDETPTSAANKLRFQYPGERGQRNNYLADGYFNVDSGIAKDFHIWESHKIRAEVEFFNLFNSVRFNSLTTNFSSGSFGKYTSLLTNARQMQFSAKYNF